jgi:hypothetical protein
MNFNAKATGHSKGAQDHETTTTSATFVWGYLFNSFDVLDKDGGVIATATKIEDDSKL